MKRIRSVGHGLTAYEAGVREIAEGRERYALYITAEVKACGLRQCEPEWEADSLEELEEWAESYEPVEW